MANYSMANSDPEHGGRSSSGGKTGFICSCLFFWVGNAFAIASMAIGVQYKDECPIEPMVSTYLIVSGATSFVASTLNVMQTYSTRHGKKSIATAIGFVNGVCSVFAFIWLIVGSVYVYRIWEPVYFLCDKTLYLFAFISITITWVLALLGLLVGCFCCCCFKD